jgi:hypothetical protein
MNKTSFTSILAGICWLAALNGQTYHAHDAALASAAEAPAQPPSGEAKPGKPAALTIQVFQETSTKGVAAEIDRIDDIGTVHFVANVDDSGITTVTPPCSQTDRFQAKPKVPAFLQVAPQTCSSTITFRLYSSLATRGLIKLGDQAASSGDLATAQADYGLAAERLQYSRPDDAQRLTALAAVAAARVLGATSGDIKEAGPQTVWAISDPLKSYQRGAKIPETGELDATTRQSLSDIPDENLLKQAIQVSGKPQKIWSPSFKSTKSADELNFVELSPSTEEKSAAIRGWSTG